MSASSNIITVSETGKGVYTQEVHAGKHSYVMDVAPNMGGSDAGPAPYDKLLSALGSCTSMTMRMYADMKKLPLESASVKLTLEKEGGKDVITREITLKGDLDETQKQKLLEIANKCPVHRTLENIPEIDTTAAADAQAAQPLREVQGKPRVVAKGGADKGVTVTETRAGKFTQEVKAGKHTFTTDEPVSMGSLDAGPSPYQELLAALGACTAMKVRHEAEKQNIPLEHVTVELSHSAEKGDGGKRKDVIARKLVLAGDLSPAQTQTLLDAANDCPLYNTLQNAPEVRTHLAQAPAAPAAKKRPPAP